MTSKESVTNRLIAKALTYVVAVASMSSFLQPMAVVAKSDTSETPEQTSETSKSDQKLDKADKKQEKSEKKVERADKSPQKSEKDLEKSEKKADRAREKEARKREKSDKSKSENSTGKKTAKHSRSALKSGMSATGLDHQTLSLINRGDWKGAAERLETITAARTEIGKPESWLAFAYMFLAKCDPLKELAKKAGISDNPEAPRPDNIYAVEIKAYSEMCQQKLDLADKTLQNIPDKYASDPTVFFALAAISGKQGKAANAIDYAKQCVDLAPDFAWGYRTIGFLEQRFIKDNKKADEAFARAFEIEPNLKEAAETLIDLRLSNNNFDGALDVAQKALEANPKNAANYYRIAQIHIQQWRLREALQELQSAISMDATDPRFYRSRASIKRYQGDLTGAIADQTKAVEFGNDKAFELVELANMNLLAGNKGAAITNLQEAFKIDPKNLNTRDKLAALLMDEKRYEDLATLYKQEIALKPKDAKLHLGYANVLVMMDRADDAVKQFVEASNLDPLDPEPHRSVGSLRIKQKDYSAAAEEFKKALSINPSVPDLVALGYCYALNHDYVEAETALVTSLALQQLTQSNTPNAVPTRTQINRSLADLWLTEGRYSDAVASFEAIYASTKATSDGPMDNFALAQSLALRDRTASSADALVVAYNALSDKQKADNKNAVVASLLKLDRVQKALDIAGTSETDDLNMNLSLAKAALLSKDYTKGEAIASRVVASSTATAEQKSAGQEELAQIALAQGNIDKADDLARKAVESFSKNYEAYETIGRVYLKKNDAKGAIDAALTASKRNPYYANALILLGDAQVAAGNTKEAAVTYRKASELYPGLLEAHKSLLQALVKLSMKEEARKEEEQIAQMEKLH
ncbi:MAG TPA: tetratricopeptide repeat protein [Drouetiella sp.]|jgi:tetratricopeptide (TPR) repeat protein